jgi:hypothetical protein
MFKAGGQATDGTPILFLGLSRENTKRLHAGQPIPVDLEPLVGIKCRVVIMAGETEEEMKNDFISRFSLTEVHDFSKPVGQA